MSRKSTTFRSWHSSRFIAVVLLIGVGLLYFSRTYSLNIPQHSIEVSDSTASAVATYLLSFTIPAPETLGSIELQICANSPLVGDACSAPTGFDISSATLTAQTGETGFSILASGTNANTVVLTRTASAAAAVPVTYTFSGVTNPSTSGSYFGRLQTFASTDASGPNNEFGGIALSINTPIEISTYVPPYLLFCVGVTISGLDCSTASGDYVNFGNLSNTSTASATTQMLTATNAGNGFNITANGTTMISGTNAISPMLAADVSRPGVSQFGFNLVANTTPAVGANPQGGGNAAPAPGYDTANLYKFVPGDIIVSDTNTDAYRLFTTSYIVNIPKGQAVGVYVATLTYICTASF